MLRLFCFIQALNLEKNQNGSENSSGVFSARIQADGSWSRGLASSMSIMGISSRIS